MAITFRSVGVSLGGNSTDCVITKPVGLAVGDLMIAQVVRKYSEEVTPPANWTSIRQDSYSNTVTSALFWKIADAGDVAAANFTFTAASTYSNIGAITAWYGHNPTNPINASNGQGNAASTTITAPAITPSVANCMVLLFCGVGDDTTQSSYAIAVDNPASWDERYDLLTTAGSDCALALGSALRPETSATGNGTATTSGSIANIGQLVAITPFSVAAAKKPTWSLDPKPRKRMRFYPSLKLG